MLEGRLYRISEFVEGRPYQTGNLRQLRQVARALATYHQLVAAFQPGAPIPHGELVHTSLAQRFAAMPAGATPGQHDDPRALQLLAELPAVLEECATALRLLGRVYPSLPQLIIHAGCRRGSAFFRGDQLAAMLDFDSAHQEARALDLAVALHDFAKIYGLPSSPDFKVPLDLEVVAQFLSAYQEVTPLEPAEIEALPALLAAKRLKRALGRYERLFAGQPLSPGDIAKIHMEAARVRWLGVHRQQLRAALEGAREQEAFA